MNERAAVWAVSVEDVLFVTCWCWCAEETIWSNVGQHVGDHVMVLVVKIAFGRMVERVTT